MERTEQQQTLIDHFTDDVDAGNIALIVLRVQQIKLNDHDAHHLTIFGNVQDAPFMLMMLHDAAVGIIAQAKLEDGLDIPANGQIARDA